MLFGKAKMFTCMLALASLDTSFAGREQCKNTNKQGISLEPGDLASLAHEDQSNNEALKNETASTSADGDPSSVAQKDQSKDKALANETTTASLDVIVQREKCKAVFKMLREFIANETLIAYLDSAFDFGGCNALKILGETINDREAKIAELVKFILQLRDGGTTTARPAAETNGTSSQLVNITLHTEAVNQTTPQLDLESFKEARERERDLDLDELLDDETKAYFSSIFSTMMDTTSEPGSEAEVKQQHSDKEGSSPHRKLHFHPMAMTEPSSQMALTSHGFTEQSQVTARDDKTAAKIRELFDMLDKDKSGVLDKKEVKKLLKMMKACPMWPMRCEPRAQKIVEAIGGSDGIDKEEFVKFLCEKQPPKCPDYP